MGYVYKSLVGVFAGSLLFVYPSLSCTESMPRVSWDYEVSPKKGKEYRRVDIHILKVERYQTLHPDSRLFLRSEVSPSGYVRVEVSNGSGETISNIVITQALEGSIEGLIRGRRILSRSPLLVEDFVTAPYNMERNKLYIGVPKLMPGETLQLEYRVLASFIHRPVIASPIVKKERVEEKVVGSYSFYFEQGKTRVDKKFLEKLMMEVSLLPFEGEYEIRVKGYADASGPYRISSNLARKRAEQLVSHMLSGSVACLKNYFYAKGLTGTPIETK
ncbi:MAG: hypothetical protein NZL86_02135 [Aquificaceae bacterium]|nr:hypothetical protein [Aquificaceae bacterium]